MKCRFCAAPLEREFVDLGSAPPSNAYLTAEGLRSPESWFPLKLWTCGQCLLVQVDEVQHHTDLFSPDYAYFSSVSSSWLRHCEAYVELVVSRLELGPESLVVEIASNDGYLLQYVAARDIPCLGIEPTAGTADASRERGIETWVEFFGLPLGRRIVREKRRADLVIANNVLAHVPDINDFVAGIAEVLADDGVLTAEFPHLLRLVAERQFDTIYHEHFSYLSLHTLSGIFAAHGIRVWDVDILPTHGGSLRVWATRVSGSRSATARVQEVLDSEIAAGMSGAGFYEGFQLQADAVKNDLLRFLLDQHKQGRKVAGYGAAAKGNTLLNYAGVRPDLLPYVVDASPHKQGRFMPGSRIPIVDEARLRTERPDFVLILPWNLRTEITGQLQYIREWGGRFVTAVPALDVF